MEKNLWEHVLHVRKISPLVHNITNYVVMNNTANALLAIGASPIMAHAHQEVKDMVGLSHSLVINIGTLDEYWAESMLIASKTAHELGKPWILDPVGAGATQYRDLTLQQLLKNKPTIIRGNASEIMALAKVSTETTKGVDSTNNSIEAINAARLLAQELNCVVCISGETDFVLNRSQTISIKNGHPLMTKVTGLGCTATALIGAFAGVVENKLEATSAAMALLGMAGELAAKNSKGSGSLQLNILDELHNLSEEHFLTMIKISLS